MPKVCPQQWMTWKTASNGQSVTTIDVASEINSTGTMISHMRPFSFMTDCFICGLVLKSKYVVRRVNSGNVKVITELCNKSSQFNIDAMQNRIRHVNLLAENASYHAKCYIALSRLAGGSAVTPSHNCNNCMEVDGNSERLTLHAHCSHLTLDVFPPTRSHVEYLQCISTLNRLTYVNTVGGGNCFFDAIRLALRQYDIDRSIAELRVLAATELLINRHLYEPLYVVEDDDQRQRAPTYALFVERTLAGHEWATELTVSAMARGLNVVVRVISTGDGFDGRPNCFAKLYEDGVTQHNRLLTVGFNAAEAHYIALVPSHTLHAARNGTCERPCDIPELPCSATSVLSDKRITRSSSQCIRRSTQSGMSPEVSSTDSIGITRTHCAASATAPTAGLQVNGVAEMTERLCSQPFASASLPGVHKQASSVQNNKCDTCSNCLRRSTYDSRLEFSTADSSRSKRRTFRLIAVKDSYVNVCSSCHAYLSSSVKTTNFWQHGWPSAIACLLTQAKYSNISKALCSQLPLRLRQSWSELGLSMDVSNDDAFEDFTPALDRYMHLTKSGRLDDFVSAMTEYAFPCVKCPAGCFAYIDECRPVPFHHYINWKFGLSVFNSKTAYLKGARSNWPVSSLELRKFFVRPGLILDKELGLSFLICKCHGKGLLNSVVHVPTNPVLGNVGLQFPDVSAAAVLTPNVIRAGRMGRWTNSNHVVAAVGGYGGISTSSLAVKYDSVIVDDRIAASSCLAMRQRSDIYYIYQQRSADVPGGVEDLKAMLNWYDRVVRPDSRKIQQSLEGSTYILVEDCFQVNQRMTKEDTDADEQQSNYNKRREFESLALIFAHPPDSFGRHPITLERLYDVAKQPTTGLFLRLLLHCPAVYRLVLRGLHNNSKGFVVKLLRFVKYCAGETRNLSGIRNGAAAEMLLRDEININKLSSRDVCVARLSLLTSLGDGMSTLCVASGEDVLSMRVLHTVDVLFCYKALFTRRAVNDSILESFQNFSLRAVFTGPHVTDTSLLSLDRQSSLLVDNRHFAATFLSTYVPRTA